MVEADHLVERAAQLLGDRRAQLLRAVGQRRVEPGLEQPDQQPGDRRVGPQHPLQVALAELDTRLPQVARVRAQHRDLPPGQLRVEHQAVELVVLGLALPQRGQRCLEPGPHRVGLGRRHRALAAADTEVVDPERVLALAPGELVRVLVQHLQPHVLQLRQHVGQGQRRQPEDPQPPALVRDDRQADGERLGTLPQPLHHGQVADRGGRGGVGLVGLRDAVGAGLQRGHGVFPRRAGVPPRRRGRRPRTGPRRRCSPAARPGPPSSATGPARRAPRRAAGRGPSCPPSRCSRPRTRRRRRAGSPARAAAPAWCSGRAAGRPGRRRSGRSSQGAGTGAPACARPGRAPPARSAPAARR